MYKITFDLMWSAQVQMKVENKQNMFEFWTSFN